MKIAVLGDSITQGIPGVNYVTILSERFPQHRFDNFGKGGDTVSSLRKRAKKINLKPYDAVIVFIGINDTFGKLTPKYKVMKRIRRQVWSKDSEEFSSNYHKLLQLIKSQCKLTYVIPPLLLGEDLTNTHNQEVAHYASLIETICQEYQSCSFVDVRCEYKLYLDDKIASDYLPISIRQVAKDVISLKTQQEIDETSKKRGLHLTLDGVHINSTGAKIIVQKLEQEIQKLSQ